MALPVIVQSAREGPLGLALATGLQVMGAWMNAYVEALCEPRSGTTLSGPATGTEPEPEPAASSPWAGGGCRWAGRRYAPPTAPARCHEGVGGHESV